MSLNSLEQVKNLLAKANNLLLLTSPQYTGDQIATGLAWALFLNKLEKKFDFVIENFQPNARYSWLPQVKSVESQLTKPNNYVISLDISQAGLQDLSYDVQDKFLKIYLTPKAGVIIPEDLSLQAGRPSYDLIITLGCQDLNSLGSIYHDNRDLFFQTPILNIDHQLANENFGTINLIDLTVSSIAEISYSLMKEIDPGLLEKNLATCLLAGIISATNSFRTINVSPQTLQTASELMKLKADRQEIAKQLFQTKTVPLLNLWGKILSQLQSNQSQTIIWSNLKQSEVNNFSLADIVSVIDELVLQNPSAEIVFLFLDQSDQTQVILLSQGKYDALKILEKFSATGNKKSANCVLKFTLEEAEKTIIAECSLHLPNSQYLML